MIATYTKNAVNFQPKNSSLFNNDILTKWECSPCLAGKFSFSDVESDEILSYNFNAILDCNCKYSKPDLDKLKDLNALIFQLPENEPWTSNNANLIYDCDHYINLKPEFHKLTQRIDKNNSMSVLHSNTYIYIYIYIFFCIFFCLFIRNNKLQTQIQLQTWTDKKHRTGRNPLGCQYRVPYPVGIINDDTNSDRS